MKDHEIITGRSPERPDPGDVGWVRYEVEGGLIRSVSAAPVESFVLGRPGFADRQCRSEAVAAGITNRGFNLSIQLPQRVPGLAAIYRRSPLTRSYLMAFTLSS